MLPKKITFRGRPATRGTCQCGKVLIIQHPDPNNGGEFTSYHQHPMCDSYKKIVHHIPDDYDLVAESEYEDWYSFEFE